MKKSFNNKAQVSMEFLILCGAMLFVFLIILGFYISRKNELVETEVYLDLYSECNKFSILINSVGLSGAGTLISVKTSNFLSIYNSSLISIESGLNEDSFNKKVFCSLYSEVFEDSGLNGNLLIENYNGMVLVRNE